MFIKLTHGLHSIINAIVSYIQRWTDDSVPDNTKTLHNFKDGLGKRPAVPLDETTTTNNIVKVTTDSNFKNGNDEISNSENILKVELKTELANGKDNLTNKVGIENTVCVPEPVIFEIQNEVPDKIEKIVPIKTQALPGQDFIFQILYVKDYNYIEGDILPVFGTFGNYARLSKDGKYLTVNSNADLSVRLILTPAPQDWIPEKPDPSIIQQAGDRMLNTIPRDGAKAEYTIEQMQIEDNFYTVSIENKATTFVTNSEFSNGKYYNVGASTNKITIPMTFSEGFDENSIYWKCYDDPKSETPVTGYYPSTDYNEEFGPLPDGFRKLQYISPNNSAYIDLGIKLKKDYKVKILMNVTENTNNSYIGLFGARNSTDTNFYNDNHTNGAYACYVKYNYRTIGFQRGSHRYFNSNHDYPEGKICWYYSDGLNYEVRNYDGSLIRKLSAATSENIDTEWNCYLFTVNDKGTPYSYGTYGNLYRCEVLDENDNLLMRLIPAKNLDTNSCGLYDIVNNKFYYNKRPMGYFTGPEFYVWQKPMQCSDHNVRMYLENNNDIDYNKDYDLPSGYEKLYEIYSKERRLDTGYKIKKDDRVECCATVDNNTNSSYRVLFGSRQSSFSDDNYFFFTRFNDSNVACYGKNAKETKGTTMTYGVPCKFIAEPYKLSCYDRNNNLKWEINVNGGTPVDCRYNCYLGCGNNSNSIDSWCYAHYHYFRVYNKDNNLVVNLIPAKRLSDNVLGFYDTVRKAFYTSNSGNYNYESKSIYKGEKRILNIENITKDINLGIIRNPVYDNPFKLEDCIEDEHQNEPKDSLIYTYEITDSKILDYFYYVDHVNNATDYATLDSTYKTANVGNPATFIVSYKSGYDNYDIKCTANTDATVTVGKTHYITYNELDIPAEYTPVKGLYSNNSSTYFKTGYIPKWDDRVECYCSITRDSYYTYPCYVFGARNGVNNKSFVFYAHRSGYDNRYRMGYDRCCGETNIREIINNELMKITADNNGCECDFAYTKTKINTSMSVNTDCVYEMYLFGCNNANSRQYGYYGNMYKFTIYNGDNQQVVNMVPVKRISDSVLGFYDTIRHIFITPAGGSVTEATEPTYKGNIVVSNIPNDTRITITKNNDSRKTIVLEEGIEDEQYHQQIDQLEYNYELKNTQLEDWFYTVKYINNTHSICSVKGDIATYYNVPRVGSITRFPVTYNFGLDDNMIEATASAGATVEITKPIEIVYNYVPDEYIILYGLYNNDSNTYFEIPYNIKATDSIKLYVNDSKNSYTYWIFGADYYSDSTTTSRVLCSKYENSNNMYYHSGNKRVNITGLKDEVIEIDCKPSEITYTNGYDTYHYTLDNTPVNCNGYFHVFGTRTTQGYHNSSFYGTIYKFTIYDDNGIKINLIPVKRKVDGVLGFYDTVQDQFYIPIKGAVTEALAPKLKGKIVVSNITDDTDVIVMPKSQPSPSMDINDSIDYSYNIEGCSLTDYWHYIEINNTTNGELTFTNAVYGGNCYTCLHDGSITMPCSFKSGRVSTDFIVSEGTLTNNGLVLNNVKDDKNITVMLNDYHDPKSDTNDDLNIFTEPDFSGYNQYRIVNGTDLILTSYSFINSQPASMSERHVFEFSISDIDLLAFNPNNIPGDRVKSRIITSDSNMNEVVQNVTVDEKLMYKHTVTLKNQIKLENGKVYIFKVRDNTDTGKLIAYAKDTNPINLVNSNNEYTVEGNDIYFNWNESNKYIVQGNKNIYFELNGIKL